MLFFNFPLVLFVEQVQLEENFPILFASSDRNLLPQITYITLVSLYPGDISNYRGMTVAMAITASFEDTVETLWLQQEHRSWPYFRVRQEIYRIFAVSTRA